jgi:methylase of polypeptide subunit release factors
VVPNPDVAAATRLGEALARAEYTEDAIDELVGADAWSTAIEDAKAHNRRLPRDATGTAIRLFFLELAVPLAEAERALGKRGVQALGRTGLAKVGAKVAPRARIAPVDGLLIASDRLSTDPTDDPPDYVSTYSPTARLCDLLTPRPRSKRALDVGTGNGIHALLAARHTRHVVATDVNPRALAFTEVNAALSGLDNVECRRGSLFEPVEGERFDLIVCNAPYVVSPERRWTYRDGAFEGDELSERVVRGAAAQLDEGGFANVCVTWLGGDAEVPDERVAEWVDGSGCDAWILPLNESNPFEYAERWNSHFSGDPAEYDDALRRWTSYLEQLGAAVVTEGAVLLHRRTGKNTTRIDEVDEDELDVASAQIQRAFAARARLDGADVRDALLASPHDLRVDTKVENGRAVGARVVLEEGTWPELEAKPRAAELVAGLDGSRTLRDLSASRDAVSLCRELLELGALELVGFA